MRNKHSSTVQTHRGKIEWFLQHPIIQWEAGILLVKDLAHRFIASNIRFQIYSGISAKQLVGLSDEDMPWAESKDIYINHEKDILRGLEYSVIEPLRGKVRVNLLTNKQVIYNSTGHPAGTFATAIIFNSCVEYAHLSGCSNRLKLKDYPDYRLTPTESRLLYFLLKGFSRSKVAERAGISTSSYDFHLRNIKRKFQADTVDRLVEICYEKSFYDIIPCQSVIAPHENS